MDDFPRLVKEVLVIEVLKIRGLHTCFRNTWPLTVLEIENLYVFVL